MTDTSFLVQPVQSGTIDHGVQKAVFSLSANRNLGDNPLTLAAKGTFASTTVTLQGSMDETNFFDIANMTLSADGALATTVKLPYYRVAAASGSGTTIAYAVY